MAERPGLNLSEKLLIYIEKERAAAWREALSSYELPVDERVDEGTCISGLRLLRFNGSELELSVNENSSRFRAGDPVYLNDGVNVMRGVPCQFLSYSPDDNLLTLRLDRFSRQEVKPSLLPSLGVVDARVFDLSRKRAEVVNSVLGGNDFTTLRSVLEGRHRIVSYRSDKEKAEGIVRTLKLNPSQKKAFINGYSSSLALVQGPPGTGKTYLLASLAASLAASGKKVLVCCFTHRAINNALNKIVGSTPCRSIYKLCREFYVDDLAPGIRWNEHPRNLGLPDRGGFVVGATPFGAWRLAGQVPFDVVIFDEAGQLALDYSLMGMACATRYVFVGDHRQMPPVFVASHVDSVVSRSVFEHLFSSYPSVMLDVTYRMNQEINEFPSQHFYGGMLKCWQEAGGRRFSVKRRTQFWDILDPAQPSVFVEINHEGLRMRSPDEARLIAHLLVELVREHGVSPGDMAVIAPFRAQVREIRNQVAALCRKKGLKIGEDLVIDTVERIQGQEREVVIVSFASSDAQYLENKIRFYFMPNRLNVAITRPRVKRILVGSKYAFRVKPEDLENIRMVNVFKKLYRLTPRIDYTERVKQME